MPKYWALGVALAASIGGSFAVQAQTIPEEYNKVIAHHSETGTLSDSFAGDRIDLSTGGLEIVQTDVDLPGNSALPVRVARRFVPNDNYGGGHFRYWSLDLPDVHGAFNNIVGDGWKAEIAGGYTDNRCSSYGKPRDFFTFNATEWDAEDYWHGTFVHLPGSGDQELLQFWVNSHVPDDGNAYHAMTNAGAVARCVPLASTSDASADGEGFEIVTPDGLVYTLNQMVKRYRGALQKGGGSLPRADFFLYPTKVADRFGNTVTYTWSPTNPWQLQHIVASDGRHLDFTYASSSSNWITAVTDGTRTWQYAYSPSLGFNHDPDTLTLPDGTMWSFRLAWLFQMPASPGTKATCGGIGGLTQRTTYEDGAGTDPNDWGSITGPSGATVTFTMAQVALGRSHVPFNCISETTESTDARPSDPYLFYTGAVVEKTITGPGLPTGGLQWGYAYGPTNNCWDGIDGFANKELYGISCTDSPATGRSVLVTAPDGNVTRYLFGNQANLDEGILLETDHGWNGTSAQRKVRIDYAAAGAAPYGSYDGWSLRGHGDPALTSRSHPQRRVTTTYPGPTPSQDTTFTWEVAATCSGMPYCFDTHGRPTKVVRTGLNTPQPTQTETIAYDDDTVHWVLGRVAQRTVDGLVAAQTTFDANQMPWKTYAFGKLKNTFTYNADGTIATVADGNGNVTTYSNWKRGIPQTVHFPATPEATSGATRSAVVRDEGWIASVTDENGYTTQYAYDDLGRITQVTYPENDSVTWTSTHSVFEPVAAAEYGLAAGHWRQTVHTGNAYKVTLFDALWRPVLVREYDAADVAGTDHYAATAYDNAGRVADASYPLGTAPTMTTAATWLLGGARPNGVRTDYDALGRPTTVKQDSELGVLTTTTEYLPGFMRRVTDARGHATTEQFMAWDTPTFDSPVRIDAPEGQTTLIGRDTFGKPTTITRGAGL